MKDGNGGRQQGFAPSRGASRGPEPTAELARSRRGFTAKGADAWRGGWKAVPHVLLPYMAVTRNPNRSAGLGVFPASGEVSQGLAVAHAWSLGVGLPAPEAPPKIRVIGFPFFKAL